MQYSKSVPSSVKRGLAWVTLFMGVLLAGYGIHVLDSAKNSADWPSVTGQVIGTPVNSDVSSNVPFSSRESYYYTIIYDYNVNDQNYINNQFAVADNTQSPHSFDSEDHALKSAEASYPIGSAVPVFFNPENPEESVLNKGVTRDAYLPLSLGLFFFSMGVYLLVGVRRGVW